MATDYCGRNLLSVLSLLIIVEKATTLELLELRVPAHVALGTRAHLSCRWVLGPADALYSVKWYKDGKEFFRHVPRDSEPCRKFPLPGVDVEESDSSGSSVILSEAVSETAGRYRCEVSGERPLFPTVSEYADMDIVALPHQAPVITGLRQSYSVGDYVQVNCTSGRSRPACLLSWYINGEPAPAMAVSSPTPQMYPNELQTTTLLLNFKLTDQHITRNRLRLKCLATLVTLYWRSNEVSATIDNMRQVLPKSQETYYNVYISMASVFENSVINIMICIILTVVTKIL